MNGDDERCCHSRFPQAGGKPRYPKLRFVYRVSPDPDASEKHAFFPVGVENEQLRSTSSINDTFSGSCPENVSFFYVVHLIFTTPFFYHSNLVCKGKINNVKPVFGIS